MLTGRPTQDKRWILGLVVATGLSLLAGVGAGVQRGATEAAVQTASKHAMSRSQAQIDESVRAIESHLQGVSGPVQDLARTLARGDVSADDIAPIAEAHLKRQDSLLGYGLGLESAEGRPWVKLWLRGPGDALRVLTPNDVDYGELTEQTAWYQEALIHGAGWRSPMPSVSTPGQMLLVYSTPVCRDAWPCDLAVDEPIGVIGASILLTGLEQIFRGVDLGEDADAYLADRDGRLVVHARMERVRSRITVHEMAALSGDTDLATEALRALGDDGEAILADGRARTDSSTGREEHLFVKRLPKSGHVLFAHVAKATPASPETLRRTHLLGRLPWLTSAVLLALALTWLWVPGPTRRAWTASTIVSAGAVVMIGFLWSATALHPTVRTPESTRVVGPGDLAEFEERWRRSSRARDSGDPAFVSTGVFLQSIEFQSANNVTVSGLVWQRVACAEAPSTDVRRPPTAIEVAAIDCDAADEDLSPGFFFLEADPGEELQLGLAYRRPELGGQVLGWRFRALLRQDFNYDAYPFDRQEVWLRVLPQSFDANVVLVPDLLAYDRTHPKSMPGLEPELILPGWVVEGSGFYYRWRDYDTDFGIDGYVGQSGFPELVYAVRISRSFLGPFVGKIIPLGVAASMLFCMVLLGTRRKKVEEKSGFSALEVVLGAAALFFVVIFDHSALREDLATVRPFYLEYFYFGMYLALMTSCVNAIIFAMDSIEWMQRHDNLLPKVLFWPAYLLGLAIVTAVFFV